MADNQFGLVYSKPALQRQAFLTFYRKKKKLKIESICREEIKCRPDNNFCRRSDGKLCKKRRKCWLPAFSLFPTMFSKGFMLLNGIAW